MKRTFISFDFDYDEELRDILVGQARIDDSPFEIADYSVKEPLEGNWKEEVRKRIRMVDLIIVICGEHTDKAKGVAAELTITREEQKPYFLLWGRPNRECKRPTTALRTDKIYEWTWTSLELLIVGNR